MQKPAPPLAKSEFAFFCSRVEMLYLSSSFFPLALVSRVDKLFSTRINYRTSLSRTTSFHSTAPAPSSSSPPCAHASLAISSGDHSFPPLAAAARVTPPTNAGDALHSSNIRAMSGRLKSAARWSGERRRESTPFASAPANPCCFC